MLEVGTHKELLHKQGGVFAAMWQAQIQTETEDENAGDESAGPEASTNGQKTIDDKFEQVANKSQKAEAALRDDGSATARVVNGQAAPGAPRKKKSSSSHDQHADPFTVDAEKGPTPKGGDARSSRVEVQSTTVPASLEDLSSPPILDEGKGK